MRNFILYESTRFRITDKEKIINLLMDLGVKYSEKENVVYIVDHLDESPGRYGADLDIIFNEDESFKMFSPWDK